MPETSAGGRKVPRNRRDIGTQVDIAPKKKGYTVTVPKWLFWMCMLGAFGGGVYLLTQAVISYYQPRWMLPANVIEDMGIDGIILFRQHDRDDNGQLSLEEFEPLAHHLVDINESYIYNDAIEEWDEVITLQTQFEPLLLESMSKQIEPTGGLDSLLGLRSWKKQAQEWKNFGASYFKAFLPGDPFKFESLGEVYYLVEPAPESVRGASLSSNRYNPPKLVVPSEILLHQILSLFHQRPFVYSRFAPQGTTATVRAFNEKYLHIVFRVHAEFQLNEPPFYPFWFTPAQFIGDLIIHRDDHKVLFFKMYVPTDKLLNVDMEWLNGPRDAQNMEVDIGFMPEMEVRSTRPSLYAKQGPIDNRDGKLDPTDDYKQAIESIVWTKEISETQARRKLEIAMYPFKEALVDDESQPELSRLAREHMERYEFPVMMSVSLPDGSIVHTVNANTFLDTEKDMSVFDSGFEDPAGVAYAKFLQDGLKKAQNEMAQKSHQVHQEL